MLVQLSDQLTPGMSRGGANLVIPMMQLLVYIDDAIFRWTERVGRQTKRTPQHLSVERLPDM